MVGRRGRADVAASHGRDAMSYSSIYAASVADPAAFWMQAARLVNWEQAPTRAGDAQPDGIWTWFPDGRLNTCHNAVDRHVAAGRGDRIRSDEHTSELQSLMRLSYAGFCLNKKIQIYIH